VIMVSFGGLLALHPSVSADVMGTLGLLAFGLNAWLTGFSLVRSSALVLTDEGLSHGVFGHISWPEIDHARLRETRIRGTSVQFIELVLRDQSQYSRRVPGTARVLGVVNRAFGYRPVCIPVNELPVSPGTVIEAMLRYSPGLDVEGFSG
jgi:hypothetical protein